MSISTVKLSIPDLKGPAANEKLTDLLASLKRDQTLKAHLQADQTGVRREKPEAQDFGTVLVAVLGTPAVTYLAMAVYEWSKRAGVKVIGEGFSVTNVKSENIADIVRAMRSIPSESGSAKAREGASASRKEASESKGPRLKPTKGKGTSAEP